MEAGMFDKQLNATSLMSAHIVLVFLMANVSAVGSSIVIPSTNLNKFGQRKTAFRYC
jgi:hypothetical protein